MSTIRLLASQRGSRYFAYRHISRRLQFGGMIVRFVLDAAIKIILLPDDHASKSGIVARA